MSYKDVYVKFRDYLDIEKKSNDGFTVTVASKKKNFSGENVCLYIIPIFEELFQYNTYNELYDKCTSKAKDGVSLSFEKFCTVLDQLLGYEILESRDEQRTEVKAPMGLYGVNGRGYKRYLMDKKIIFINLTYRSDVKYIMNELVDLCINKLDMVNVCKEKCLSNKVDYGQGVNVIDKSILEIEEYIVSSETSDLVIIYSSSDNYLMMDRLRMCLIKCKIAFISCLVNDLEIKIGPLTIPGRTSCAICEQGIVNRSKVSISLRDEDIENNQIDSLRTLSINRNTMSLISAGILIDEVIKYLTMDMLLKPPLTINHEITIDGLDLSFNKNQIIHNPDCVCCKVDHFNY